MFDYEKYNALMSLLKKEAQFVPMDPASGGMPPEGAPPPGDPAAGGMPPPGDPAAGMPPPGDPAAAGMPPMDPSMTGGMPPMDPAAMGAPPPMDDPAAGGDVSPSGEPYMKITPTQLSKLFKQFAEVFKSVLGIQGQPGAAPAAQPAQAPSVDDAKLTEILAKLDAIMRGG